MHFKMKMHLALTFSMMLGLLRAWEWLLLSKSIPRVQSCTKMYNISVSQITQASIETDTILVANLHECKLLVYLYESGIADHGFLTNTPDGSLSTLFLETSG